MDFSNRKKTETMEIQLMATDEIALETLNPYIIAMLPDLIHQAFELNSEEMEQRQLTEQTYAMTEI